jgi:hypothetical protein
MKAFVITPYKKPFIEIYNNILRPAIERAKLTSIIAKDEPFSGPIPEKILEFIREANVCVADLTETNPNVMYEVAVAHSLQKPVVLITQGEPETLPFDIRHHRVIRYTLTSEGLRELSQGLFQTLQATLEFGESPTKLLKQMLVPSSLGNREGPYIVAASPLSYREANRSRGGWKERPIGTYADHIGVRGLMQSFGLIYGTHRLPEYLDPDDFDDEVFEDPKRPGHFYSIASPKANRLTGLMMKHFFKNRQPKWEFKPHPESSDLRNPKLLIRLDGEPYKLAPRESGGRLIWDYGLVIRGPHPFDSSYMLMILAGRSARGTEACCLAATDPECLQKLSKRFEEEHIDLDNHKHAFCAVVSICTMKKKNKDGSLKLDPSLGPDKETFRVEGLSVYK